MVKNCLSLRIAFVALLLGSSGNLSAQQVQPPTAERVRAQALLEKANESLADFNSQRDYLAIYPGTRRKLLRAIYGQLNQAVSADPTFAAAYAARADFRITQGYQRANYIADYLAAIQFAPTHWEYRMAAIRYYAQKQDRVATRKLAEQSYDRMIVEKFRTGNSYHFELALFSFYAERFSQAVKALDAHRSATWDDLALKRVRGLSLAALGRLEEAKLELESTNVRDEEVLDYRTRNGNLSGLEMHQVALDAASSVFYTPVQVANLWDRVITKDSKIGAAYFHRAKARLKVYRQHSASLRMQSKKPKSTSKNALAEEQQPALPKLSKTADAALRAKHDVDGDGKLNKREFVRYRSAVRLAAKRLSKVKKTPRKSTEFVAQGGKQPSRWDPVKEKQTDVSTPKNILADLEKAKQLGFDDPQRDELEVALRKEFRVPAGRPAQPWLADLKSTRRDVDMLLPKPRNVRQPSERNPKAIAQAVAVWDTLVERYPNVWQVRDGRLKFLAQNSSITPADHLVRMEEIVNLMPVDLKDDIGRLQADRIKFLLAQGHRDLARNEAAGYELYGYNVEIGWLYFDIGLYDRAYEVFYEIVLNREKIKRDYDEEWRRRLVDYEGLLAIESQNSKDAAAKGEKYKRKSIGYPSKPPFPIGMDQPFKRLKRQMEVIGRLAHEPDDAVTLAQRACAKVVVGDETGALADFTHVIELEPNSVLARCWRAGRHLAVGDYAAADADIEAALELHATSSEAFATRGAIRQAQWRLDDALADYAMATKYSARRVEAYARRAAIFYYRGELEKMHDELAAFAAMQPPNQSLLLPRRLAPAPSGIEIPRPSPLALPQGDADRDEATRGLQRLARGDLGGSGGDFGAALALLSRDEDQDIFSFREFDGTFQAKEQLQRAVVRAGRLFSAATRHKELGKRVGNLFPRFDAKIGFSRYHKLPSLFRHEADVYYKLAGRGSLVANHPVELKWLEDLYSTGTRIIEDAELYRQLRSTKATPFVLQAGMAMIKKSKTAPTNLYPDPLTVHHPDLNPDIAALRQSRLQERAWEFGWRPWTDKAGEVAYYLEQVDSAIDEERIDASAKLLEQIRDSANTMYTTHDDKKFLIYRRFQETSIRVYAAQKEFLKALRAIDAIIAPHFRLDWRLKRTGLTAETARRYANMDIAKERERIGRLRSPSQVRESVTQLQAAEAYQRYERPRQLSMRRDLLERRAWLHVDYGDPIGAIEGFTELIDDYHVHNKTIQDGGKNWSFSLATWLAARGKLRQAIGDDRGSTDVDKAMMMSGDLKSSNALPWDLHLREFPDQHDKRVARLLDLAEVAVLKRDNTRFGKYVAAARAHVKGKSLARDQLIAIESDLAAETYQKAVDLKKAKKYKDAISLYKKAVEIAPDHAVLYQDLFDCYSKLGDDTGKLVALDRMLAALQSQSDPSPTMLYRAYRDRGLIHYLQGYYDAAIRDTQAAAMLQPEGVTYLILGASLRRLGRIQEGDKALDTSAKLSPEYKTRITAMKAQAPRKPKGPQHEIGASRYIETGAFRFAEHDFVGAAKDLSVASKLTPDNADMLVMLSDAHLKLKDVESAMTALARAVELKDKNADLHRTFGRCLVEKKKYHQALEHLSKAIELEGQDQHRDLILAYGLRGAAYLGVGELRLAVKDLARASEIERTHLPSSGLKDWLGGYFDDHKSAKAETQFSDQLSKIERGRLSVRVLIDGVNSLRRKHKQKPFANLDMRISDRDLTFVFAEALMNHAQTARHPEQQLFLAEKAAALGDLQAVEFAAKLRFDAGDFKGSHVWCQTILANRRDVRGADPLSEFARNLLALIEERERQLGRTPSQVEGKTLPKLPTGPATLEPHASPTPPRANPTDAAQLAGTKWECLNSQNTPLSLVFHDDFTFTETRHFPSDRKRSRWDSPNEKLVRMSMYDGGKISEGRFADPYTIKGWYSSKSGNITWIARRSDSAGLHKKGVAWELTETVGDHELDRMIRINSDKTISQQDGTPATWESFDANEGKRFRFSFNGGLTVYEGRETASGEIVGEARCLTGATWPWSASPSTPLTEPAALNKRVDAANLANSKWSISTSAGFEDVFTFEADFTISGRRIKKAISAWDSPEANVVRFRKSEVELVTGRIVNNRLMKGRLRRDEDGRIVKVLWRAERLTPLPEDAPRPAGK